jgi:hypothetical protein
MRMMMMRSQICLGKGRSFNAVIYMREEGRIYLSRVKKAGTNQKEKDERMDGRV